MRKRITNQDPQNVSPVDQNWIGLQRLAQVELADLLAEKTFNSKNKWPFFRRKAAILNFGSPARTRTADKVVNRHHFQASLFPQFTVTYH